MSLLCFFHKVGYNLERSVGSRWIYGHLYLSPCNLPFVTFHYAPANVVWGECCLVKDFRPAVFPPIIRTSAEGLQGKMQRAAVAGYKLAMRSITAAVIYEVI